MESSPSAAALVSRFVAGREIEDALRVGRQLNRSGLSATLAYLGESITELKEASAAREVFLRLIERLHAGGLEANISLKLTQLGLDLSESACRDHLEALTRRAAELGGFLRVDMESSAYTERTLSLVAGLHARYPAIGAVIQSSLYRSEQDLESLIGRRIRVRLCKGAYDEPPEAAFARKSQVDRNFEKLARRLLLEGAYPALATHDERLLRALLRFAEEKGLDPNSYELQMLYGVRRDLQASLAARGRRVRIYVPFGDAWYPYFMRRLAERPANVYFVVRSLLRG